MCLPQCPSMPVTVNTSSKGIQALATPTVPARADSVIKYLEQGFRGTDLSWQDAACVSPGDLPFADCAEKARSHGQEGQHRLGTQQLPPQPRHSPSPPHSDIAHIEIGLLFKQKHKIDLS